MGCCLLAAVLAGAPRIAFLLWWFFDPARIQATFTSWIVPVIGFIFLPWTMLAYVLVAPGGVSGFEWAILLLGLLFDVGTHGGSARSRR
jgi:hypothetical protein